MYNVKGDKPAQKTIIPPKLSVAFSPFEHIVLVCAPANILFWFPLAHFQLFYAKNKNKNSHNLTARNKSITKQQTELAFSCYIVGYLSQGSVKIKTALETNRILDYDSPGGQKHNFK